MRCISLKSCPFCGGRPQLYYYEGKDWFSSNSYYPEKNAIIRCKKCGMGTNKLKKASVVSKIWNTRLEVSTSNG